MRLVLPLLVLAGCASSDADPTAQRRASAAARAQAAPARTFSDAAYNRHIAALRARLAKLGLGDLAIRIEDPFVVVGEGTADELELRASTVRWAVELLERDFFDRRPTRILDVYLFGTAASYERGVKKLTGESPGTPYGFYSRADGGLFMNIATGGGTLVHEIVHPYVEADFPSAPPWLNEGLGSLFEQSAQRDGHIVGLTNWRLAGLQEAIAEGAVPSFRTLTSLDSAAFYGRGSGTHYAQARYLLYYLQDHGRLRDFYRAFRAARAKDPTGYATLVKALGASDMAAFEQRWQAYVARLRFP
jgi:hypothetical protein